MLNEGTIQTAINSGIATITFFHPQSNSLPGELLRGLATAITNAGNNSLVNVIVLRR